MWILKIYEVWIINKKKPWNYYKITMTIQKFKDIIKHYLNITKTSICVQIT
jgi:hypothetical protein